MEKKKTKVIIQSYLFIRVKRKKAYAKYLSLKCVFL